MKFLDLEGYTFMGKFPVKIQGVPSAHGLGLS